MASSAAACPCSDDAGTGLALTRDGELAATSLVMTTRRALGVFDARGNYRAQANDESETAQELLLRTALRWPSRLEWLAELGYAQYRFRAGEVHDEQRGLGDLLLRARYQLLDESMPHAELPLPAVAASLLLRAPLGAASRGASSGFGSGGAQLGLGAWELGAGVDASRSLTPVLGALLATEVGYRFEDEAFERRRQLGLRSDSLLGLRVDSGTWASGVLAVRARLTADATFAGRELEGTGERLWSLVLGGGAYHAPSGLRSSVTLSWAPPLAELSAGSSAQLALGVALGFGLRAAD